MNLVKVDGSILSVLLLFHFVVVGVVVVSFSFSFSFLRAVATICWEK